MAGNTYYDQLSQFNDRSTVAQTYFVLALVPHSFRGLLAIIADTAVHLILLAVITTLFLFSSHGSTLGNAWATVAQLAQDRSTKATLDQATLLTDTQVGRRIQR